MGRNLDLDNCPNKPATVIAAYTEELEENERRICDEGAWAISLDMSRITCADIAAVTLLHCTAPRVFGAKDYHLPCDG